MTENDVPPIYSDVPIRNSDEDQYSFTSVATKVVEHLMTNPRPESFVVGVTGQWGIGKTSMLNLIEEQYKLQQTETEPVIVFSFSPLKDVDRDTMLSDFLLLLTNFVEEESRNSKIIQTKLEGKIDTIKRYALAVQSFNAKLNPYFQILSSLGVDQLEKASNTVENFTNFLTGQQNPPNIDSLYKKAYSTFLNLKIPIVVLIDDIDRLYPSEIIGMLTLLRSTVHLPYITYFVSYDPVKVEEALTQELNSNGKEYLEKYIQAQISVPRVSRETISNIISDQASTIFNNFSIEIDWSSLKIISTIREVVTVFMNEGAIKTTRDAYKIINTIQMSRYTQPMILDLEIFLKTSIIKLKYSKLYEWIENTAWIHQNSSHSNTDSIISDFENQKLENILNQEGLSPGFRNVVIKLVVDFEKWEI